MAEGSCATIYDDFPRTVVGGKLKKDIHPEYMETEVTCSCGNKFTTRSTRPELRVEICSECHPFYSGKQKLIDSGGRVERFQKRFASHLNVKEGKRKEPPKS